jgi:hypothetical protein
MTGAGLPGISGGHSRHTPAGASGRPGNDRAESDAITYAIADLHGRYDLLSEAVTRIVEHSKSDRPATVITLGDYVDRGPKSRLVIERLMD